MSFFWNKLGLAFQIVLVVVAVFVFSFFDPFGWLAPKQKKLQDTPITVSSIREIGQLITAEYFGEVLSSLQESLVEEIKINDSSYWREMDSLRFKLADALDSLELNKEKVKTRLFRKKRDLIDHFYEANESLVSHVFFQDVMQSVIVELKKKEPKLKQIETETDLLKYVLRHGTTAVIIRKLNKAKWFAEIKNRQNKKADELTSDKRFIKRQIVAVGRGWVRAGIDFGTFNEKNFKYDKERGIIYLFGVSPTILACDINPWFIPDRKVKGFEIIAATGKAKSSKYLEIVKRNCLEKLYSQALSNGILKLAQQNAETSLKSFFSLLVGQEINKVVITTDLRSELTEFIQRDTVSLGMLAQIDRLLLQVDSIDRAETIRAISELKQRYIVSRGIAYFLNRYLTDGIQISMDSSISKFEWDQLVGLFKHKASRLDSVWLLSGQQEEDSIKKVVYKRTYASLKAPRATFYYDSMSNNDDYRKFMDSCRVESIGVFKKNRCKALENLKTFLKANTTSAYNPRIGKVTAKVTAKDSLVNSLKFD